VILVDSNVPMYLVGTAHPNKDAARTLLERALIDAEPPAPSWSEP
jgi:predicted nucleic acid-binding protein